MPILTLLLLSALSLLWSEDGTIQKITLDDGRTLLGRYDQAAGTIGLVDEKTAKVIGTIQVDPARIARKEDVKLAVKAADPLDKRGINGKWITSYDAALKLAAETRRPVFAVFTGSDWCPWCMKLEKEIFSTDRFKTWAKEHVVLLYLDFPQEKQLPKDVAKQNEMLAAKYGVTGYPHTYFINDKGVKYDWQGGYSEGGVDKWIEYVEFTRAKLVK